MMHSFLPQVSVSGVVLGVIFGLGLAATAPPTVQGQTTYTVTNTNDSGAGSLRAALTSANDGSGTPADIVEFDISGGGPHVIQPTSTLPTITDPIIIDGTSEPDHPRTAALDAPAVEIDGQNAGPGVTGLTIDAANVTVKGLALTNFGGDGIRLNESDALIGENYIGVSADGSAAGNGNVGIAVQGDDARIGDDGSNGTDGNVISNSFSFGIGFANTGTEIVGNRIGTSPDGTRAMGNGDSGIQTFGSSITIGGPSADERNVISGNAGQGIRTSDSSLNVMNNYIGVTADGTTDLGNDSDGVRLRNGASNNTIGPDNVISGNGGAGVRVTDATDRGTTGNVVEGNLIGTNVSGIAALANDESGVVIEEGAADNSIGGGTTNAERNVISGNEVSGVSLLSGATDNTIRGNYVGTRVSGIVALSNAEGIVVASDGGGNTIGGSASGAGNLVSGNNSAGIVLNSAGPNTIQGNRIGVDENGDPLGNGAAGIEIGNTQNVTVGGTSSGAGNTIAHNANGIIVTSGADGNALRGNAMFANTGLGIDLGDDGETANDAGDGDDGPNRLQNAPAIQSADYDADANEVTVTYLVPSDPGASGSGASAYPLAVDFYETGAGGQQGRAYLGTDTYSASSPDDYAGCGSPPCSVTATFTPQASVTRTDVIVATATDDDGNTSEFSTTNQPLPVELASFEGTQSGEKTVDLTWTTAAETNNAGFVVQRHDAASKGQPTGSWSKVGFVDTKATGGTTTEAHTYRFTAENLPVGTHQFRLKQIDLDGTEHVHDPVSVELQMQEALRLGGPAPNPVRDQATVSFAVREDAEATITLFNTLGQQVRTLYRGTPGAGEGQTVEVSTTGLSSGVYFLRLRADGRTETQRLTVVQ